MITTTHKGYEIRFDERVEKWECIDLQVSDKKLSGCKAKINEALREIAKIAETEKVRVFVVEYSKVLEGVILGRDGETFDGQPRYSVIVEGKYRQFSTKSIVLDTPETRVEVYKSAILVDQANVLRKESDAILQTLPRYVPPTSATPKV